MLSVHTFCVKLFDFSKSIVTFGHTGPLHLLVRRERAQMWRKLWPLFRVFLVSESERVGGIWQGKEPTVQGIPIQARYIFLLSDRQSEITWQNRVGLYPTGKQSRYTRGNSIGLHKAHIYIYINDNLNTYTQSWCTGFLECGGKGETISNVSMILFRPKALTSVGVSLAFRRDETILSTV